MGLPSSYVPPDVRSLETPLLHRGRSMLPVLRPLDQIGVEPLGPVSPRRGDVIAFRPPGEKYAVAHRVLAVRPEGLLTRGDNCASSDPWLVGPKAVLGRVTFAMRSGHRRRVHGGLLGRCVAAGVRAG